MGKDGKEIRFFVGSPWLASCLMLLTFSFKAKIKVPGPP